MTSLTRDDARRRAALLSVTGYDVRLDLTTGERRFGSVTTVRFDVAAPGGETFVDLAPHELRAARLNGVELDVAGAFDAGAGRLRIAPRAGANELVVDAVMSYSHDGEGLHRHVDVADGAAYLYAMSFLDAAPRWFACFDQPDLKAPLSLVVRCPQDWVVFGNGRAEPVEPGVWRLAATAPLATYFTTLVAGPYTVLRDEHDGIALALVARRSLAEHLEREAPELFAHTRACLDRLHELFGVRYPWGDYVQAFVPDFNAGAMENPGCVTLRDAFVFRSRVTDAERLDRAVTLAHEMAHMWFGDLVTMRWWDDLWLNESFAEYLGNRVVGEHAWVDFGINRKSWGYAADRRPSTHPVAGNGAPDAETALSEFDGISYAKGASVLRQLAAYLGDDAFLAGLRRYIGEHAHGNAEFADLIGAWTAEGAEGLPEWSAAWLRTTGLDTLAARGTDVLRHSPDGTPRTHAVTVAAYDLAGAQVGSQPVVVSAGTTPTALPADAVLLPDATDATWAKLVLPAQSWRAMPTLLCGIADPRARVAVWNALQLAVADAELDPAVAVDVVAGALPAETDDAVLAVVSRWARRPLAACYLDGAARQAALARLSGSMLAVLDVAEPGSARQLAAVRAEVAVTTDVDRLRAWLDGRDTPAGLVVDTELRWALLLRLAALGELDEPAIEAEAGRDRSSQGAVHAARVRAARPDPAAKAAAWEALMGDADRPNYELYALAEGFWDPDQRALTDPYVERYHAEIAGTARLRSGWVVDRLALLAYPWTAVDERTLAATDRLLAADALPPGLRRSLVDASDDLRRAVTVRTRFAH